jgi:plasmid stabilization system protein ParE
MPATVEFHRLAADEYRRAVRAYRLIELALAQRFRAAVDRVVESISESPDLGAPFRGPFRWMRTRRFPYVLYYEALDPSRIMVYAVAHARRRPGYWQRRPRL